MILTYLLPVAVVQSPRSCWADSQTQSPAGQESQMMERPDWLENRRTGRWEVMQSFKKSRWRRSDVDIVRRGGTIPPLAYDIQTTINMI